MNRRKLLGLFGTAASVAVVRPVVASPADTIPIYDASRASTIFVDGGLLFDGILVRMNGKTIGGPVEWPNLDNEELYDSLWGDDARADAA